MAAEALSTSLFPTYHAGEVEWAGEGYENETKPHDVGIRLTFPIEQETDAQGGDSDDDDDGDSEDVSLEALELTARNRVGVDLTEADGKQLEGTLEIDVAYISEYGLATDETALEESAIFDISQKPAGSTDRDGGNNAFELTVRAKIVRIEITGGLVCRTILKTPYGLFVARGHLPGLIKSKASGVEEKFKPDLLASGQWIVVAGFPCFDITEIVDQDD